MSGCALIIGASGGIGRAVFEKAVRSGAHSHVIGVSRSDSSSCSASELIAEQGVSWVQYDADEASIKDICLEIAQNCTSLSRVYICTGILHEGAEVQPEKRIEGFDISTWQKTFEVNTLLPMLWLKYLTPLFVKARECKVAAISARVGSISDNQLGGWYSYRASKSALNMLLKTASIEFARRAKGTKLIAFHPGTTDTALSKPFQKNVPPDKLFSPDFVAECMIKVCERAEVDGTLSYLDWDGKPIQW